MNPALKRIRTSVLEIAYEESGAADGAPVFLMHGWPYDPRCYDAVIAPLTAAGARVIVPYLRGFGPTRFLDEATVRSGQQAALGNDLRELMDALSIDRAVLAGYDWGGRGASIVAALWPERVRGLVTVNAPTTSRTFRVPQSRGGGAGAPPLVSMVFSDGARPGRNRKRHSSRQNSRRSRLWSPHWSFDDATFARSAASFDNPDFRRGDDPIVPPSLRQRPRRSYA